VATGGEPSAITGCVRHLEWDGCFNARDLGGLPTRDGGAVRPGALVRADSPAGLSAAGWSALRAHGVRTIVDLRNEDELKPDAEPRPPELATVHIALDNIEDTDFWDHWAAGPQFGTPLYYRPFLDRFPRRTASVITAVARARPGGVLVHCVGGRDLTGLITMLLLSLAGVAPEDIADDYVLSTQRLPALDAHRGETDQGPALDEFLAGRGTSAREVILSTLESLELDAYARAAGVAEDDLIALRARLVEPPT
jgi:protein tyrosine/serine phosphatase